MGPWLFTHSQVKNSILRSQEVSLISANKFVHSYVLFMISALIFRWDFWVDITSSTNSFRPFFLAAGQAFTTLSNKLCPEIIWSLLGQWWRTGARLSVFSPPAGANPEASCWDGHDTVSKEPGISCHYMEDSCPGESSGPMLDLAWMKNKLFC